MRIKLQLLFRILQTSLFSSTFLNRVSHLRLSQENHSSLIIFAISPEDINTPSKVGRFPDKIFSLHKTVIELGLRSQLVYHPWVTTRKTPIAVTVLRIDSFIGNFIAFVKLLLSQRNLRTEKGFDQWWKSLSTLEKFNYSIWSNFLDKSKPEIVFGIDLSENLVVACKQRKIPIIEVMHGVFSADNTPMHQYSRGAIRLVPVDLFLSWHPYYSRIIESYGIATKLIGYPNYELSEKFKREGDSEVYKVLVTLSWGVVDSLDPFGMLHHSLACKLRELDPFSAKLVFRLHPVALGQLRGKIAIVKEWFDMNFHNSVISTPDSTSLFEDLATVELHITEASSSFYESGLAGVPTIFTSREMYEAIPAELKEIGGIFGWYDDCDIELNKIVKSKCKKFGYTLNKSEFISVVKEILSIEGDS
jgi:hypothetical protein